MVNIKKQFENDNKDYKVKNLFVLKRNEDVVNKMLLYGQINNKYFVAVSELKSGKWNVADIKKYDNSIRAIESFAKQKKTEQQKIA